jgi:hypothetical protein
VNLVVVHSSLFVSSNFFSSLSLSLVFIASNFVFIVALAFIVVLLAFNVSLCVVNASRFCILHHSLVF